MLSEKDLLVTYGEEKTLEDFEKDKAQVGKAASVILERFLRRLGRKKEGK